MKGQRGDTLFPLEVRHHVADVHRCMHALQGSRSIGRPLLGLLLLLVHKVPTCGNCTWRGYVPGPSESTEV